VLKSSESKLKQIVAIVLDADAVRCPSLTHSGRNSMTNCLQHLVYFCQRHTRKKANDNNDNNNNNNNVDILSCAQTLTRELANLVFRK